MSAPLLWQQTPQPGCYINSVAISADGGTLAAGTFFHVYSSSSVGDQALGENPVRAKTAALQASATAAGATSDPSQYGTFVTQVYSRAGEVIFEWSFQGWQGVYWVDLSANAAVVASGGWYHGSPDYCGFVMAADVQTGNQLLLDLPPARVNMVSVNAQGTVLVAGADQGYVYSRGENGLGAFMRVQTIPLTGAASGDTATVVALDASGSVGLIASYHGEVILFGLTPNGPSIARWQIPGSVYVHFAALSADGSMAYVGGVDGKLYAFVVKPFFTNPSLAWSVAIAGGAKTIYGVACNADGSRVAVAGNVGSGGVVQVFAASADGAVPIGDPVSTAHSPNSLSFDASGYTLSCADGHPDDTPGAFYLYSVTNTAVQLLWSYGTNNMSWPMQVAANASMVVGGSDNGSVYAFHGPL